MMGRGLVNDGKDETLISPLISIEYLNKNLHILWDACMIYKTFFPFSDTIKKKQVLSSQNKKISNLFFSTSKNYNFNKNKLKEIELICSMI